MTKTYNLKESKAVPQDRLLVDSPLNIVADALNSHGIPWRWAGKTIKAHCPVHGGTKEHTDIGVGRKQPIVSTCWSGGCEWPEVRAALNLEESAFYVERPSMDAPLPKKATTKDPRG